MYQQLVKTEERKSARGRLSPQNWMNFLGDSLNNLWPPFIPGNHSGFWQMTSIALKCTSCMSFVSCVSCTEFHMSRKLCWVAIVAKSSVICAELNELRKLRNSRHSPTQRIRVSSGLLDVLISMQLKASYQTNASQLNTTKLGWNALVAWDVLSWDALIW